MGKMTTEDAYTQVYGKNYVVKSDDALEATVSRRDPGLVLNDGDKIKFLDNFKIVEATATIGGQTRTFDTFAVLINDRPVRFSVSMLANTGFDGIVCETESECAALIARRDAGENVDNGRVAHTGKVVEEWQNAGNQKAACEALSGKKARVKVIGYMAGTFDAKPKRQYQIEFVK